MSKTETAVQALTDAIEHVTGKSTLQNGTLFGNWIFDELDIINMLVYLEDYYSVNIDAVEHNITTETSINTVITLIEERI